MGTTTFSGPIKAGVIKETTGTTLGSDVKNTGQVVMAQSQAITQADGTTKIVIPANSQIVAIELSVTAVWDGAATTAGIGWTGDATALTAATAVAGGTLGIISATAGADATRVGNWANVGTTDRRILVTNTNTGAGTGFITVRYVQNNNLS
jgi:hypothetical protein